MEAAGSTFGKPGRIRKTTRSGTWNEHRRRNYTQDASLQDRRWQGRSP